MNLDSIKYNTLIKLITFVKFNCEDKEARYLAASPIVGDILKELLVEFNEKFNREPSFIIEEPSSIYNLVIEGVKCNLQRTDEWQEMDDSSKINHIKNLCMPYIVNEEQINELLQYADNNKN